MSLLNFVRPEFTLVSADGPAAIEAGTKRPILRRVFICHEISPANYYVYLWGPVLRSYFALACQGHVLATNLHADTFEQTRDQGCLQNGVPPEDVRRMHLMLFLMLQGGSWGAREVTAVWESDVKSDHRRIFERGVLNTASSRLMRCDRFAEAGRLLDCLV